MIKALKDIIENIERYKKDYIHDNHKNIFWHKKDVSDANLVKNWFTLD